ncbi:MAG: response regulator [Proteobacteria bacterium]|nr:response regulator [Pseudomonadota bacterium]
MKKEQKLSQDEESLLQNIKLNVMLVEDDDLLADSIKVELQKYNADVQRAEKPDDAFFLIEGGKLDIVIIEIGHPSINAYHTINAVRTSLSNSDVPIIALVPNGNIELLGPACRAGATSFLPKPIVWYQFHQLIQSMHWRMVDERRNYRRVEVSIRVLCAFDGKKTIGHSIDVSASGLLLKLEEEIPVEKQLAVTFPYVEGLAAPFLFYARVARLLDVSGGGKLLGLDFLDIPAGQSERLLAWIDMFHYIDSTKIENQLKE